MTAARWGRCLAVATAALAALVAPRAAAQADPAPGTGLQVEGTSLLRDGVPFLPRGFNMVGLLTPDWCARSATVDARAQFGQTEMAAATAWQATVLRFQVSQRGLADPTVAAADRAAYLQKVVAGVALARANGFAVVLSMQDQYNGCGPAHPLPTAQTVAAWDVLAPAFAADRSVAFELFNEPGNDTTAAGWAQWRDGGTTPLANQGAVAVGHETLVQHLRALGVGNLLIADVAKLGERSQGIPLLDDPAGNLAYAIHPYYYTSGPAWWDQQYGSLAALAPVIATEWDYLAAGCGGAQEQLAPALLAYLRAHGIGVLGHSFDQVGTLIADWAWTPTACGTAAGGSGAVLQAAFAGQRDAESPPSAPANLRTTGGSGGEVDLAWDPATDDVGVAGYQVVRDGTVVGSATGTTFADPAVPAGATVVYTVRALDAGGGTGPDSAPLTVLTPAPPPDTTAPTAPATLTARLATASTVALSWPAATDDVGVAGYEVSRDGVPLSTVTGLTLTDTPTATTHVYSVVALDAAGNRSPSALASATVPTPAPAGLTGAYYDTATFGSLKKVRTDPTVNFAWGTGAPVSGMGADTFSVVWTGRVLPLADGTWTFYTRSDEGVRLYVDGALVISNWTAHTLTENQGSVTLTASQPHDVRIEYYEKTGSATMKLLWSGPGTTKQVVPSARLLAR